MHTHIHTHTNLRTGRGGEGGVAAGRRVGQEQRAAVNPNTQTDGEQGVEGYNERVRVRVVIVVVCSCIIMTGATAPPAPPCRHPSIHPQETNTRYYYNTWTIHDRSQIR